MAGVLDPTCAHAQLCLLEKMAGPRDGERRDRHEKHHNSHDKGNKKTKDGKDGKDKDKESNNGRKSLEKPGNGEDKVSFCWTLLETLNM